MESRLLAKKLISDGLLSVEGLAFKSGFSYSTVATWLAGKTIRPCTEKAFRATLEEVEKSAQKAAG